MKQEDDNDNYGDSNLNSSDEDALYEHFMKQNLKSWAPQQFEFYLFVRSKKFVFYLTYILKSNHNPYQCIQKINFYNCST